MKPQSAQILALLRYYGDMGMTQHDAIREARCYRLAARIADLKADGYAIRALQATDSRGHRYARYVLDEAPVQMAVGF